MGGKKKNWKIKMPDYAHRNSLTSADTNCVKGKYIFKNQKQFKY